MTFLSRIRKDEAAPKTWSDRHPFADLHAAMDRLLADFAVDPGWRGPTKLGVTFPSVNVSENAEMVRVTAEFPGMGLGDIQVSLEGDRLVLAGEKSAESEEEGRNWRRRERTSGSFRREVALPADIDAQKIDATFKNGVLTVEMVRTIDEAARPKRIEVKSG